MRSSYVWEEGREGALYKVFPTNEETTKASIVGKGCRHQVLHKSCIGEKFRG